MFNKIFRNKRIKFYNKNHVYISALVIILLAVVLTKILISSHAQSPYVSVNASNGTLSSSASIQTDTKASNGSYVLFSPNGTSVVNFINTEGVNIHAGDSTTPYGNSSTTFTALSTLGIHNVRDNISPNANAQEINNLQYLANPNQGIKFDFLVSTSELIACYPGPNYDTPTSGCIDGSINKLLTELNSTGLKTSTISLEGANELDNVNNKVNHANNWQTLDQTFQSSIFKDNGGTYPLVGPSLVGVDDGSNSNVNDAATLGDLSTDIDYGNVHAYPNQGNTPEDTIIQHQSSEATSVSKFKQVWATETGYVDCISTTSPAFNCGSQAPKPVPQADQGILDPRIYLASYINGVGKTFIYELFNEGDDHNTTKSQPFQDDWGLFNYNSASPTNPTIKPSGQAISNMNSILSQNTNATTKLPNLNYQVKGDKNIKSLLLTSGDQYKLIVWENAYPGDANYPACGVTLPSPNVTITLQQKMNITEYSPSCPSNAPSASSTNSFSSTTINDSIGPAITIYSIKP